MKWSNKIKKWRGKPEFFLGILGFFFVIIYSHLYISTPNIFNSPDETANFVFIENFVENGSLSIEMKENPNNMIKPRSVNIIGDSYVPGSFIGLILVVGYIARVFGLWVIAIIPALISVLGVFAYFGLIKRVFSKSIAFYSAVLMFFLPQWWYYSAKGLLPNIAFLSFFMIAGYAFVLAHESLKKKAHLHFGFWMATSGIAGALSLAIRPSELWWMLLIVVSAIVYYRKKIKLNVVIYSSIAIIVVFIMLGYWNYATFGGLITNGYSQLGQADSGASFAKLSLVVQTFFPFGVTVISALEKFWLFTWQLFWWQLSFVVVGIVCLLKSQKHQAEKFYLAIWSAVTLYLILYYGSWEITDDLDSQKISIGISYIRYWLIIFVGSLPFIVIAIKQIHKYLSEKGFKLAETLLFSSLILGSVFYTYGVGDDNLGRIRENIVEYNQIRLSILEATPEDAVIISERNDKIIWPLRQVIHYQDQNFDFVTDLSVINQIYPIYWQTILPDSHVKIWEQKVFAENGFSVNFVKDLNGSKLYQIINKEKQNND